MKKILMVVAVIAMFLFVATNVSACDDPSIAVYTEVSGSGKIKMNQYSDAEDVIMQSKVRMSKGTLDFKQKLEETSYSLFSKTVDEFTNNIHMNGKKIYLDNIAGKSEDAMEFEQKLKIAESSSNGDELKSKQVFRKTKYSWLSTSVFEMTEILKVHPTANSGHECEPDALQPGNQNGYHNIGKTIDTMMHQSARATGDYLLALMKSEYKGDITSTKIEQFNAADWTLMEQMMIFS